MNARKLLLAPLMLAMLTATANAAAITWTDGTFTTDAILPTHDVQYAVGFGNASAVTTASGLTFGKDNQTNVTFNTAGVNTYNNFLGGGGTTGDPGLDTVLANGDYSVPSTLTLIGLIPGAALSSSHAAGRRYAICRRLLPPGRALVSDTPADGSHFEFDVIQFAYAAGSPAIGASYLLIRALLPRTRRLKASWLA